MLPAASIPRTAAVAPPAELERALRRALIVTGIVLVGAGALGPALLGESSPLTTFFFRAQDALCLSLAGIALVVLAVLPGAAPAPSWMARAQARPFRAASLAAALVCIAGVAGTYWVFKDYPLSRDEVMADFDAAILREGRLVAAVPAEWRPWAAALQPLFRMPVAGDVAWASSYLPGNAALRALVSLAAPITWTGPLLAAVAVMATAGIARRLWPARPDAALVAALLVATSPQVLFTAMTPYAMSAHLALNLVWLWLFLRGGRAGHAGAIAVGFLACGLHQVVFHPLFVAPFLMHLALGRRFRLAAVYAVAYLAIGTFWASYWRLALAGTAVPPEAAAAVGAPLFVQRVLALVELPTLAGLSDMAKNLLRFVAWQNPLAWPLAALGAAVAWRQAGMLRPIALGIVGTIVAVFLLLPFQGHGWGYRYLHGFVGSLALVSAAGWVAATREGPSAAASALLGRAGLCAVLVLVPIRAAQIASFVWPYADSYAAILRAPQEVVIVDPEGIAYGQDLVRNDPFLRNRPKLFDLASLDAAGIAALCGRGSVGLFDRGQAAALGMPTGDGTELLAERRTILKTLGCGIPLDEH